LLQASIPGPNGSFYVGTDQEPLVIRHFDANGALCPTAQTPTGLQLLRLGPTGAVTHQTSIAAKQGTATPLTAPGGRLYFLHALPNGYLAISEKTIAKHTFTGKLEWANPIPTPRQPDGIAVTGNTVYLLYGLAGDSAFHVVKLSIP
jgi:hypothetical protein